MRPSRAPRTFALLLACAAPLACGVDAAPSGLRATPPGDGPRVVFDPAHRPLPAIPMPNDIATVADPSSRTGRRISASLVAPTAIESVARQAFDELEGWGTFAPITVQFERAANADPRDAAIDLADVRARMQGDDYDPSNDPVYLVNLTTGVPMILDVGNGNFPLTLRDLDKYWPNDPHVDSQNLLFETHEEGAGLTQAEYTPALDQDFDGVLDHPNTLGPLPPGGVAGVDDLMTWYERETDTLRVRPLLPLDEKTEYAVVLTDRLRSPDGRPVRSPFPQIHHPAQTSGVRRLQHLLGDASRAGYFGDIAGTGLDHVAFAWTFTTQPTHEDMELLRNGLYGKGPFARFATQFPPKVTALRAAGKALTPDDEPPGWTSDPVCAERAKTPFVVKAGDPDIKDAIHTFFTQVIGAKESEAQALDAAIANIDHIVLGTFQSPYLQGDPADTKPEEARFHVNYVTGEADVHADTVHFWMTVPKPVAGRTAPFDVAFWQHGVTGADDEIMIYAGDLARQGIATIGIDMPEHGRVYDPGDFATAQTALRPACLVEWVTGIGSGRARDYDQSGKGQSGWFWWTSHAFHVRDNVRQGLLDMMQAVRILRSFDGVVRSDQDTNGDGAPDLAGDFDGDGAVDVGGPHAKVFASGESLGGMMTEGIGGIEPYVTATAPMSGGAGMMDIGLRSYGVTEAVFEQVLGPLVIAIPASARPPKKDVPETRCTDPQRSVRLFLNDGDDSWEVEIACLGPEELDLGMTVIVSNEQNGERRCARTLDGGAFRVPIPASVGDRLVVDVLRGADAVDSYDGCKAIAGAEIVRRVATFEQAATQFQPVGTDHSCPAGADCAQFRDQFYPVGSPLVAPNGGYGIARNTPELRRLFDLIQTALDPADNATYAPYYMLKPLRDENGNAVPPHALLVVSTTGDGFVDIATGYAFARAAGALPFLPPSAVETMPAYADYATPPALYELYGRKTPNQVLVEHGAIEGVARLARTHAGAKCGVNYDATKRPDLCTSPPGVDATACAEALWDPDWDSEGGEGYDQPHPDVPLRLARFADVRATDDASLERAWTPRLLGAPFSADGGFSPSAPLVAVMSHYLEPKGRHTWDTPDLCRKWDFATYGNGLIARFFATSGTDLYFLSHPKTHGCLVDASCDFFR